MNKYIGTYNRSETEILYVCCEYYSYMYFIIGTYISNFTAVLV